MPLTKILRLGLIHVAVAITLVPINSTLNRVMISELGLAATLVAALVSLPYLFSPVQVWIGGYSDRHPLLGYRRTPYIALGLLLCTGGAALAPTAAFMTVGVFGQAGPAVIAGETPVVVGHAIPTINAQGGLNAVGLLLALLAFGAWGMGFNFATVSYLSLATDLAGEDQRAKTVGVMWFMLIASVIATALLAARALEPFTVEALYRVFYATCGAALLLGFGGLIGLERRGAAARTAERQSFAQLLRMLGGNPQARLFFVYLIVLLIAILGQDLLLEPYAADVFGVPVNETTRYTGIWGGALLLALLLAGPLTRRVGKTRGAALGGSAAAAGLLLIALSGILHQQALLLAALVIFGLGSGISTATNLALMLDMTIAGKVGAFIGAWGMADALARLFGTLLSGVVRDGVTALSGNLAAGYITVFLIEALALGVSLLLLRRISVSRFREGEVPGVVELAGYVEL
jgi:BCD family chlorophyll transporter-like MFS transporter